MAKIIVALDYTNPLDALEMCAKLRGVVDGFKINHALWSQSVCSSIQLGDTYTSLQINQAIENANLCGYFLDSENAMLSFDDGGIVYLKSKQELINEGQSWIENCNHFTAVSGEQAFSITKDGVIVIRAVSPSKKYKTIKN